MCVPRCIILASAFLARVAVPAEASTYGDWNIGAADDKSYIYAATSNDSGDVFGEYCYFKTKTCSWILGVATPCDVGHSSVVLANSDTGAVALELKCFGAVGRNMYTYAFMDWKTLETDIKDVSRVGFALALASNKFAVVRFSLKGRSDSTAQLESSFSSLVNNSKQGTVDERL